jgi:phage tail-like protein
MSDETKTIYLNRENRWADFRLHGLELRDGTLRLDSLPLLEGARAGELASLPEPKWAAGLAVGDDGTIYYTDPRRHAVLVVNACDGTAADAPCLGGEGALPTLFSGPRALLIHKGRRALFVADSRNHRVQIFDTETFQLVGIWGPKDPAAAPQPSDEAGGFNTPWSLAADGEGNVYVVEVGNWRVQKFDALGRVVKSFWDQASAALKGASPTQVAVGTSKGEERVYVLSPASQRLYVLDTEGQLVHVIRAAFLRRATGLVAGDGAVYVGNNERRRVLKLRPSGRLVGEARGFRGPVAALALDGGGRLLVHTGCSGVDIVSLDIAGAYAGSGFMWGGPFGRGSALRKDWHRIKLTPGGAPPPGAHLSLFVFATDDLKERPPVDEQSPRPFAAAGWQALPPDASDALVRVEGKSYVWVGAEFQGEGASTPVVSQMRLDYDHEGYLRHFPAIYREETPARVFLQNFLALYESLYGDVEEVIERLGRLFDAGAAPAEFLSWLAGWLALSLDERWTEERQRQAIARAFSLYARRGTAAGLRESLQFFAGVEAHVEEPVLHASWWSLAGEGEIDDRGALLGFGTTLAPEEAQGAVVGTTATYDESTIIRDDEFGAPLFANVAHRFLVRLYQPQAGDEERRRRLEAVVEREKPAHAAFHLCVVEPAMRVGFQARLGVDTVVGGGAQPARLGQGADIVLGGEPAGRIGERSRLGLGTRLGDRGPNGS